MKEFASFCLCVLYSGRSTVHAETPSSRICDKRFFSLRTLSKHALWRFRVDRRRHCGETGAQTRANCAKDGYWHKLQLLFTWRRGYRESYFGRTLGSQNSPIAALVACVSRRDALFSLKLLLLFIPSSPCLRAC